MKKLMIALGAIACAAGLQAASLNWTIMGVPTSTAGGTDLTKYTALLYFTEGAGTVGSKLTTVAQADVIKALTGSSVASGYAATKNLTSAGAVGGATGVSTAFGDGDSVTGFAVILDGSVDSYSNYIVTGLQTATWTSSTGAKTMIFGSQASATWTPAPEPTSGLLLLLGMAGLALKRKIA